MRLLQIVILLLGVVSSSLVLANPIDSLYSNEDVQQYIRQFEYNDSSKIKLYSSFVMPSLNDFYDNDEYLKTADSLHSKLWFIADFDGNGLNDLIALGQADFHSVMIVFCPSNNGNVNFYEIDLFAQSDWYRESRITQRASNNVFLNIVRADSIDLVQLSVKRLDVLDYSSTNYRLTKIPLTLKFGAFIEFNEVPNTVKVVEVAFFNSMVFPVPFRKHGYLKIRNDGEAYYELISYYAFQEKEELGMYYCKLEKSKLEDLFCLLNYINWKQVKDSYSCGWTDLATYSSDIVFENDTVKEIEDYGQVGPYSLLRLYSMFDAIVNDKVWIKSK